MVRRPGDERGLITLLFTDIVGSSEVATELGDQRWHRLQARHHAVVRKQLKQFGGREVDTAGDGFFVTFSSPARGLQCAFAIVRDVRELGLDVRAGLHFAEAELTGEKLGGIAVTTAARVAAVARPGQVLATDTVVHLVAWRSPWRTFQQWNWESPVSFMSCWLHARHWNAILQASQHGQRALDESPPVLRRGHPFS